MACFITEQEAARARAPVLTVERDQSRPRGVLSRVSLVRADGSRKHLCDALEPPWKNNERNVSCIPVGTYKLRLRPWGGWGGPSLIFDRFWSPFGGPFGAPKSSKNVESSRNLWERGLVGPFSNESMA